ncbi:MAG: arsenic resistance N-acetyltransferase ArsN2 [Trueperaceae bacterium]
MTFATATEADLDSVLALLEASRLPKAGVADHIENFILALEHNEVIGCAGLEVHGNAGLLRSVATRADYRNQGLGTKLTESILDLAEHHRLPNIALLTETAKEYFLRFGFVEVSREDLSEALQASAEFKGACPDSATAMLLTL